MNRPLEHINASCESFTFELIIIEVAQRFFISKSAFEILRTYIESRQSLEISQAEYNLEYGVTFFFCRKNQVSYIRYFSVVNVNKF